MPSGGPQWRGYPGPVLRRRIRRRFQHARTCKVCRARPNRWQKRSCGAVQGMSFHETPEVGLSAKISPKPSHAVTFKRYFIADDRYILSLSLSNKHTVERILVRTR